MKEHTDVLIISESKLGNSFPDGQPLTEGYSAPFRLDQNKLGGVSCFQFAFIFLSNYFHLVLALKVSLLDQMFEKEWLLSCSYNPEGSYIESHLNYLFKSIDALSSSMRT